MQKQKNGTLFQVPDFLKKILTSGFAIVGASYSTELLCHFNWCIHIILRYTCSCRLCFNINLLLFGQSHLLLEESDCFPLLLLCFSIDNPLLTSIILFASTGDTLVSLTSDTANT